MPAGCSTCEESGDIIATNLDISVDIIFANLGAGTAGAECARARGLISTVSTGTRSVVTWYTLTVERRTTIVTNNHLGGGQLGDGDQRGAGVGHQGGGGSLARHHRAAAVDLLQVVTMHIQNPIQYPLRPD